MALYDSIRKVDPKEVVAYRLANPGVTLQEIAKHFSKRGITITAARIHQILKAAEIPTAATT